MCNWLVPVDEPNPFCASCGLNEVIPDLTDSKNFERWEKLEMAKRRCIYTFLKLDLPLDGALGRNQSPLRFRFLEDKANAPVQTGHETWAHYLHIIDTLEIAASFGISVDPDNTANNGSAKIFSIAFDEQMDFDTLLASWIPLTCALNSINRGMGLSDLYPFVIPPAVVEKLRFIHALIHESKHPSQNAGQRQSISEAPST
jgi:hypothetical protein